MPEMIEVRKYGYREAAEDALLRARRAETTLANARAYVDIARSVGVRHWVLDELERILDGPVSGEETIPPSPQSPCHFVTSPFSKGDKRQGGKGNEC